MARSRHGRVDAAWWWRLVPQRWRPSPAPLDCSGPAGPYAAALVHARLSDPAWADDPRVANPPTRWPVGTAPVPNARPFPTAGQTARNANTGRYPT